jgi:hypothetical protein
MALVILAPEELPVDFFQRVVRVHDHDLLAPRRLSHVAHLRVLAAKQIRDNNTSEC